ncbi:MAG: cysteine synthase A [Firmicutes bacterium]|nr:cysteine synthase A [Bacillota bacterium]MCM1401464.1 cysteine synthase A [Bacteroides sp.]MCM1476822.1 cysteine synthase A [Bacteroides sp.]
MAKIHNNLIELIGSTPLVEVHNIEQSENLKARLLVKVESFNPGGSVKDRIALAMIEDAEAKGELRPGSLIVEPTSGNTGIGLAWVSTVKGYRLILTMPETMSIERRKLLKALGAELVLTPGAEGMKGAIKKAEEIKAENPGAFMPLQFDNPANPEIHYRTTGQEIWKDTDGKVDIFVAGVGTGGTLSGTSRALKEHNPAITTVAVEPASSPVLAGGKPGPHKIQGIGAGFVPANYDAAVVNEIIEVSDEDAFKGSRLLAQKEGILAGISSGAALFAAIELARKPENEGKTIVALLPDTGERYLSTPLFDF